MEEVAGMRRHLVAVAGSLAVLLAVAAAAIAVVDNDRPERGSGYGMGQMMNGQTGWGGPDRRTGPRHGMHGAAVTSEFGYLTEMIAHHEEAVAAATELERSDRAQMRAFAKSVAASQTAQIERMTAWLAEWYPGRSTTVDYQPMMRDLTGLSGDRLDRAFLQDMIPHHMTAVMMSQQLLVRGLADHHEVDALAASIRDEQHAEIFWMQRRLAGWFSADWRHEMGPGMGRWDR